MEGVEAGLPEGSPGRERNAVRTRGRVTDQPERFAHVSAGGSPGGLVGWESLARARLLPRQEVVFRWVMVVVVGGFVVASGAKRAEPISE